MRVRQKTREKNLEEEPEEVTERLHPAPQTPATCLVNTLGLTSKGLELLIDSLQGRQLFLEILYFLL